MVLLPDPRPNDHRLLLIVTLLAVLLYVLMSCGPSDPAAGVVHRNSNDSLPADNTRVVPDTLSHEREQEH